MNKYIEQYKNSSKVTIYLWVVIFLLVNYISYGLFARIDLSRSGKLRLTSETKKLLRSLPEKVTIEAFISDNMPEGAIKDIKQIRDFLSEYQVAGGDNMKLLILNPDTDDKAKKRSNEMGINANPANSELANKYLGLLISYGSQKETVTNLFRSQRLEYDITNKIYKMAYPNRNKIGYVTSNTRISLNQPEQRQMAQQWGTASFLKEYISAYYSEIEEINLAQTNEIPQGIQVLILNQLSGLSHTDKYKIDQYLVKGGNLIILASGFEINWQTGVGMALRDEDLSFYRHLGVAPSTGMVADTKSYGQIPQPYPVWVISQKASINQNNLSTTGIRQLILPWPSSLSIDESNFKNEKGEVIVKAEVLATSTSSATVLQQVQIHPQAVETQFSGGANLSYGTQNLMVHLQGKFKSFYANMNNHLPKLDPNSKKEPEKDKDLLELEKIKAADKGFKPLANATSNVFFIGSPYFIIDNPMVNNFRRDLIMLYFSNFETILGMIDVSFGKEQLVKARNKDISQPVLGSTSILLQRIFTALNFLIPLGGFAVFGLLRFKKRRKLATLKYEKVTV